VSRDPTLLFIVWAGFMIAAQWLMRDLWKNQSCKECPHCSHQLRLAEERKDDAYHASHHLGQTDGLENCRDLSCPGLKRKR
jgi:hypothetical protein